jgi:hypothetical protein
MWFDCAPSLDLIVARQIGVCAAVMGKYLNGDR